MMPDSVIADAASQPEDTLDLSQMLGAPRTPNPAQVAQAKGNAWKEFAPILAMLPIVAAKGGRVGVAAMLSGLERSQREREAQQMRAEQMGMQRQQFDATQQARQQAIQASADQQRQRMAQELLRDLASGLQGAEDEQQAQQFIDAMLPAIQQAGIPVGRIEAMRMQLAAPSRMTQKRARKALDAVLATTAKEDLGSVRVNFDGQALGVDELAALANGAGGMQVTRGPKQADPKPVTFSNNLEEVMVNGQPTLVRAGSDGKLYDANGGLVTGRVTAKPAKASQSSGGSGGAGTPSPTNARLVETVLANPSLWDDLTPSVKSEIAPDLAAAGFQGFGKRPSDSTIAKLSESRAAIASLRDLRNVLQANEQYIGPIAGYQALNPYSEARKARANIDLVRQRVGKALEGGVLRKEDEEKYKKILATLTDEPGTAIYKVDNLIETMERDMETFIDEQRAAGRRVSPTAGGGANAGQQPPPRGPKVGERRRINGKIGEWDGKGWKAVQ